MPALELVDVIDKPDNVEVARQVNDASYLSVWKLIVTPVKKIRRQRREIP
jgi:hypothetical protein